MDVFNIAVIGDTGVGKSSITLRYVQNRFVDIYDGLLEDSYRKQVRIDEESAILHIVDLEGSIEGVPGVESEVRNAAGFLMVYSITSRVSFEKVAQFRETILRLKDRTGVPIVLIANKSDMERQVETEEGVALSTEWGVPFFETSATLGLNVEDAFVELVREIRRSLKPPTPLSPPRRKHGEAMPHCAIQ